MKPKRQKNHETPVLFIGDPELEASVRRVSSLRKLVVERGHFSAEELTPR